MGTTRTSEKRTDDETVPAQAAGTEEDKSARAAEKAAETEPAAEATEKDAAAGQDAGQAGESGTKDATEDEDGTAKDAEDGEESGDEDTVSERRSGAGIFGGAGAVVAAGLGLASVTGTYVGRLMGERQTLMGQIKLQSGQATDQIAAMYGTPWHTTALVNGVFALLAVLVAVVVLAWPRAAWVRAVAWGGLALGVLGLLVSAGMYFDLFANLPTIPKSIGGGA
ncbi:putative hypothetical protein [Streptomyces sp. NBRC 110611]|uniref:hypothetical protein n=1 Tax=Streptomyces sp. NBRC 110611 TaxID=1621259 RepID=UPI0008320E61|nr:hypothetical protein [Streptomyces sp. NBRC 110611]GAU65597.1 putative hypothetical protein [Streptomyces sp. NBRC 110611]